MWLEAVCHDVQHSCIKSDKASLVVLDFGNSAV